MSKSIPPRPPARVPLPFRRAGVSITCACLALAPRPFASPGQLEGARTVYVSVVDGKGEPIAGLAPADFSVREDGRPRPIVSAEISRTPMSVALMLDDGGLALQSIREGAARFVQRLQGAAEISLTTTAGRNVPLLPATTSTATLMGAINRLAARAQPGSFLVEGLAEAARDFAQREARRPVIVSVANEGDEYSGIRPNEVLAVIQRSGAQVYLVRLGRPVIGTNNPAGMLRGESNVDDAAVANAVFGQAPARSGGRSDQLSSHVGIPVVLDRIAGELLGQYAITYTSADPAKPDLRLQVETTRRGAKIRAQTRVGPPR